MPRTPATITAVLAAVTLVPAVAFATTTIEGTAGDDKLRGTAQADTLSGLDGHDELLGYDGDDALDGGRGNDRLTGGKGVDTLKGGPGNDRLTGGPGRDVLKGGPGNDTVNARDGEPDTVSCGGGTKDRATLDPTDVIVDATVEQPGGSCEVVDRAPPKTG